MQDQLIARLLSRMPSQPVVTIGIVVVMALATVAAVLLDAGEGSDTREALDRARTFYEQNAEVEVSGRNRQLLGPAFVDVVSTAYEKEKDRGAGPIFSARMQGRTQRRFDALADEAFDARMREFPAWRFGVGAENASALNHVNHVFVHAGLLALLVSVVFFAIAGVGLEAAWGALVFAPFCLLAAILPSIAFRLFDDTGGVPLAGATGLVAAVLGAYCVRGIGARQSIPGWALLPVWAIVELLVVRGLRLHDIATAPFATMATGVVFGAIVAGVFEKLDVEEKLAELAGKGAEPERNTALVEAEQALELGSPEEAWSVLSAAHEEDPDDEAVLLARFRLAVELGRVERVVDSIVPILKQRIKRGETAEAVGYWRAIMEADLMVELPPAALVRLGEGLLDEGHPDIALETLTRALDHPTQLSTSLARRVVRVARDLDPTLTHRAAAIALEDPELDPASRESLEALADEVRAAMPVEPSPAPPSAPPVAPPAEPTPGPVASPEPAPGHETTRYPIDSDIDLESQAELTDPAEFDALHAAGPAAGQPAEEADPNAVSIASMRRELSSVPLGLEDGQELTDPSAPDWNDPGARPDLSAAAGHAESPALFDREGLSGEHLDNSHLDAGALSPDALQADLHTGVGSGSDTAPLPILGSDPGRLGSGGAHGQLGASHEPPPPAEPSEAAPLAPLGTTPLAAMDDAMLEPAEGDTAPIPVEAAPESPPVVPAPAPVVEAQPPPPAVVDAPASPFGDDDLDTDFELGDPPLRPLKLVVGIPIGAKAQALEIQIEGKGVSRVPFERIEAVAVAAVSGLSDKPVLIVDLVLNWLAAPDEPLKVVRFHSNRFDPTKIVPSASSALDALRRLVAGIIRQSGASPLPDDSAAAGSPFARYTDSAHYEREVLGAEV